jgi:hypothetical protein
VVLKTKIFFVRFGGLVKQELIGELPAKFWRILKLCSESAYGYFCRSPVFKNMKHITGFEQGEKYDELDTNNERGGISLA